MKFPLVIVYNDPKDNWDKIVKNCLFEEIKRDGFDNFTVVDEKTAKLFLEYLGTKKKKIKKPKKIKDAKKIKKPKKIKDTKKKGTTKNDR